MGTAHERHAYQPMNIGILGAGFVGLTLAARLLESENAHVFLLENDLERISQLQSGHSYVYEPGLQDIITEGFESNMLTIKDGDSGPLFDALFVTVGTPKPSKDSDVKFFGTIQSTLSCIKQNGMLILRSTVSIGTTIKVKEMCDRFSRHDLQVIFAPERTAEGAALEELRTLPQIIGADSNLTLNKAIDFFSTLGFSLAIAKGSREAELSKLACNTWRDVTFGFSNELARLSGDLGIDFLNVVEVANSNYPRANIPKPGPVGGPCLTKDSYILSSSFNSDAPSTVIMSARHVNERILEDVVQFVSECVRKSAHVKIVISGLAFKGKPETNDLRDSFGMKLALMLRNKSENLRLEFWDPSINEADISIVNFNKIQNLDTSSQILILANNSSFVTSKAAYAEMCTLGPESYVVDLWDNIPESNNLKAQILTLGRPSWKRINNHE
jgi:UDP-N-acetyl-D-mannosaminuronic acid dehydrogenase